MLKRVRGYHVAGQRVTLSGLPISHVQTAANGPSRRSDPNGDYQTGQLYVQQFSLTSPRSSYPLLLWHGGGMTGVTWEDTPDGRPGWHDFFMRAGYDTYVSDAVERGRASWARYPEINPAQPEHRPVNQAWEIFRFGPEGGYSSKPEERRIHPNQQFPTDAVDQFSKQFVARWTNSDPQAQTAYDTLVSQTGPCVILAHSQGCSFALQAAQHAPDKVKAVVLIEPAGVPSLPPTAPTTIPYLIVWGDHFEHSALWQQYRANVQAYVNALEALGAAVTTLDLPLQGIYGNSHMIMMDKNSDQVAALVQDWMDQQGLITIESS